ncbi:PAS domain S-box-containing protein [Azospirillum agricola]|uniref:PAS domain-containing hybrid sensor histidine kinase/response regulator n=1 Tax=Azospirillum agricola TaxID=1720247 RepID=UPI002D7ECE3C|nr:PAS domain-containing protein [Azospirillum agricola]MBP2232798.1 PAS domain S-box-containing protein [Azospirillum agricola]
MDALRARLAVLEAENAALRRVVESSGAKADDLRTIAGLNDDLRAALDDLERSRSAHAESEGRLRAILDSATEHAIVTLDANGRVTSWNPGATRILGWSEAEILGKDSVVFHTPEDAEAGIPAALRAAARAEGQCRDERWFHRKDGAAFWGAATILPLLDGKGGGFLSILYDRTRERSVENAIQEVQQRATDVLDSIDEAFLSIDREYRVTYQNRRAEELDHLPLSAVLGRRLWEIWPEMVGSEVEVICRRAMEERVSTALEKRFEGGGRELWVEIRYHPTPEGIGCFFRNITARKRAEEAAAAQHARTVEILESISDAFYTLDHDWRFTYINSKAEQIWGRKRDTLLGRVIWDAFPEVVGSEPFEAHRQAVRENHMVTVEALSPVVHQWIEASIYPSAAGLSVYFRDITGRRAAQDALLRAKEAAEQASIAKGKFLAAASHDLRQPLQALLLFVDVLKPHVQGSRGESALMHLARGLDALKDLLDSLLDMSRLDAGIVEPSIEDVPLQPLFEHIAASYRPVAAARGLDLRVEACRGTARSDRTLLVRMVRNLVENALRYTETGRIDIECRRAGDRLLIEVRDTGIGIPSEHLERIWEEFHQVGNPERDRNRGLGLGLAIVRRLSQLLDHPVGVRSVPGKGTAFTLAVPAGRTESASGGAADDAVAGRGRFAVLVDDDAIVLLGLETIFREWGYEVLVAGSADSAVEALTRKPRRPDIVVADYRLREGRTGTEAVARIRALFEDPGREPVPGVILTGETGPDCERDAAAHGLGVIHKPVTPRQLSHALGRLFSTE